MRYMWVRRSEWPLVTGLPEAAMMTITTRHRDRIGQSCRSGWYLMTSRQLWGHETETL